MCHAEAPQKSAMADFLSLSEFRRQTEPNHDRPVFWHQPVRKTVARWDHGESERENGEWVVVETGRFRSHTDATQ
jgi:hypothetical protein